MKWTTVRLIAAREIRDLLRDRRTLMIVLVLPAVLYPAFVVVGLAFTSSLLKQKAAIGVVGGEYLPPDRPHGDWLVLGSLGAVEVERRGEYPPLFVDGGFHPRFLRSDTGSGGMQVRLLESADQSAVDDRSLDAVLIVPPDLLKRISEGKRTEVRILGRDGDETSKLAVKRVGSIVARWREAVKQVRFTTRGMAADFDQPFEIVDPDDSKSTEVRTADELRDVLVKFLPFLLVMWTMAGALHPAVDLTAGEKERGTMETLLICPAGRNEIVTGKFLAVFVFSYASSLWNLMWMALGALLLGFVLPFSIVSFTGLGWTILLAIPPAAMFSAVALGLGAFARSSKEGQYYLLPLMLATLPLSLFAMTPGLKLTPALSAVPISGLSLILQNLLAVSGEPISPACWILGVGSSLAGALVGWWWAVRQFRSERVLFRGEEGGSLRDRWRNLWNRE